MAEEAIKQIWRKAKLLQNMILMFGWKITRGYGLSFANMANNQHMDGRLITDGL